MSFYTQTFAFHTERQIIMVVQANPNTKPGGVQGALAKLEYNSDDTPGSVYILPSARPKKLSNKNPKKGLMYFFILFSV